MRINKENLLEDYTLEALRKYLIKGVTVETQGNDLIITADEKTLQNPRGAGRKRYNEEYMDSLNKFDELYHSQKSIQEIMDIMGISKATAYRYKKVIDAQDEINKIISE